MSLNYYYFRTPREAIAQSQPVILAKEAGKERCLFSYISLPQLQTASIFVRSQRHSDSDLPGNRLSFLSVFRTFGLSDFPHFSHFPSFPTFRTFTLIHHICCL